MFSSGGKTLEEWGEFRFLSDALLPLLTVSENASVTGDDCAVLTLPDSGEQLVVTSDATPTPLVTEFPGTWMDVWGWYSVLINASDLAAAAATPLGFTSSVEAPRTMPVDELHAYFVGVRDACAAFGLSNAGGNLRQAPRFESHGTAFGTVPAAVRPLTRRGAQPGDVIVVVGGLGHFIAAFLKARRIGLDGLTERERGLLFRPVPKLLEMAALAREATVSAASDNSDGVLGSVWNIVTASHVSAELELDDRMIPKDVHEEAQRADRNCWNLAFFWGDWQVVATVPSASFDSFGEVAARHAIAYTRLGHIAGGEPALRAVYRGREHRVNLIRNENFTAASYNSKPMSQVEYQLEAPVFSDTV